jgi:glucose uptake protein
MKVQFLLWLAGAMAVFLSAATASRAYISTNNIFLLVFSLALYCGGNLMMVRLMREGGLGLAISASAIAQLLLINIIAFAVFDEKLSLTQMAGVGFGIVSMLLLLFPMGGKA